jgi:ornithine cyclodeaminase/alanine dehydrogenase-like protein (mu-crystallin family)
MPDRIAATDRRSCTVRPSEADRPDRPRYARPVADALLLLADDVRGALDMPSLIDAMSEAFDAYSSGRAELPGVIHLDVPEARGEIHVKAGHLHGGARYAVKVASGFYGSDPPALDGLVLVFDATDGSLAALLLDGGYLTDARTGAAGGLAARHLAPERVETVAVLGTGAQARHQLDALACERSFDLVRLWGRDPAHARSCASELEARGLPASRIVVVRTPGDAVRGAEVVLTCTAATEPLVRAEWLAPGVHVTAVGADGPAKRELEPAVLGRADLVVVDSRDQCARLGELHHALDAGVLSVGAVVELGEIAGGHRPGRISEEQITVCDLTGVGVQDVAAAALVLDRARADADRIRR